MPLIPKQHTLSAVGGDTRNAIANFVDELTALPPVKLISLNTEPWEYSFLGGRKREGLKIIAVLEEV